MALGQLFGAGIKFFVSKPDAAFIRRQPGLHHDGR